MSQSPANSTGPGEPAEDQASREARIRRQKKALIAGLACLALLCLLVWIFWRDISDFTMALWNLLQDREAFRQKIESYGVWAPAVFVVFQIFQVLFSPIPGELVGAAGGYVFGFFPSLVYSTIGLSIGSWMNFAIARGLGRKFVERMIPPQYLSKIAYLMERQGVIASFIFFVIPGFPKDYFCYALGLSPMSWRIFLVVSSAGRIPGTLLLSLQGAMVYQENYWAFIWLGLLSLAFIVPVYVWRERIYKLLYRLEKNRGPLEEETDADS